MPEIRRSLVLRPGEDGWECWMLRPGNPPVREPLLPSPNAAGVIVALPTRELVALPLWLPAGSNLEELAGLELTSRHLLRRGMAVRCQTIESAGPRVLVLALAAGECAEALAFGRGPGRFEIAARTWPPDGADIVVWREGASMCFALYRGRACVFFAGGSNGVPALCGAVVRASLRLRAEDVLEHPPRRTKLYGTFPADECRLLQEGLGTELEVSENSSSFRLPDTPIDLPPPRAEAERAARAARGRLRKVFVLAVAAYGIAVAGFLSGLGWEYRKILSLEKEAASLSGPAAAARSEISRWREIRAAVDPRIFALDLLAAVAADLPSDQVRLTLCSLEAGGLAVAGEAPSVPEAYEFFEKIRRNPALTEFEWTAEQPELAGQRMVRFEMKGRLPYAPVVEE